MTGKAEGVHVSPDWRDPYIFTKRDYIAALIMAEPYNFAGPMSPNRDQHIKDRAELSVKMADALIEALNKRG